MLQAVNLTKIFGARTLFEEVTFSMVAGEKLGLVGRNGSGKSTLFKLILGEESPDDGRIVMPKGYRVGHLAQHLTFTKDTVLEEACLGLPPDERDQEYRGEIILEGLGFSEEDMRKSPQLFSGGFQIRINLAKLLLSEPNLLLLDEPTNYLDIVSMRWLTTFLKAWRGEIILISHDRLFMDSVTTHSMFIHRGKIRKIEGPTEKLYAQVSQDEELYEKSRLTEEKKRKQLEEFIARFRAQASKATLVQSKVKALERMGEKEELSDEEVLDFQFCQAPMPGKQMLDAANLTFHYPNGPDLISKLSVTINKGDRVGIIGKNGKGKSTLLRLFAGDLLPGSGSVTLSQNAKLGYFGQTNISRLNPKMSVEEEIEASNKRLHRTKIRAICGTMMFSGDDALKKISVLSGGEKSRVLLGKILAEPTNLLLLDEPTNHLDMESIEALIESLTTYEGAVIIVTHSELILKRLINKLIVFQGEIPHRFDHDYEYFLQKEGWGEESQMSSSRAAKAPKEGRSPQEARAENNKAISRLEKKIASVEERIMKLETQLREAEESLAGAYQNHNDAQIESMSENLQKLGESIEASYTELETLSNELKDRKDAGGAAA